MSMSTKDAVAFVRSLIKESTATFWTDDEINMNLAVGMQTTWSKYSQFLYERKKSWEYISLISGEADYPAPDDCFKISKILVSDTGSKLPYVHDDELFKYDDASPPDSADYLRCFYLPNYVNIESFPDSLQPLVCVEAIIFSKSKDEGVSQDLLDMRAWYEDAIKFDFASHNLAEPHVFPDFSEEESFGSEYAWTYKEDDIHLLESASA